MKRLIDNHSIEWDQLFQAIGEDQGEEIWWQYIDVHFELITSVLEFSESYAVLVHA